MIVEISGLTKVYEDKQRVVAVNGIDLLVNRGEIFGLLGPNGAGKTTTISICTTRARPTSGVVRIAGTDVVDQPALARRNIGVVPQYNTLDRALSVFENLYFHCRYFGFSSSDAKARADELLQQFLLQERGKSFPNQLSGGLQQRVQIARAIAHRPAVLFLDEPSAGLDPQSRIAMWEAVEALRGQGITVVLTTHYMEEADELCDRVAIVDHGKILALDTPEQLKTRLGAQTRFELKLRRHEGLSLLVQQFQQLPNVQSAEITPEGIRVFAKTTDGVLAEVVQSAQAFGVRDISISEPSLETVFIGLTGRDLRE
ncbi:daunorubicin resistance ABC transporter ATPase subunit [Acidisarcina polymorpha]|uniref:Daunorubicin resistance ABC transporter ATPase subunit n=1 Tax=Acidisarcina polymorpha TaxID=2211140 RepID=A0A2Z5FVU4_9BACT|nr:daunorubicin resistance ABC transporter ATPase subunit [Acidisarcina polymorpha]